ncbi:lysine-specific demethylase 5A-like [Polyodon spathula]|uniref:lysine-specific demethylase 5A-like n=1 Tax=Polyodon spathula TaxID=7913 RepID=UPI001B7F6A40|nr:lysine-specific demethylase 5A-like [Polyodon spathula]
MGYPPGKGTGSLLRSHFERILFPYELFQCGATLSGIHKLAEGNEDREEEDEEEEEEDEEDEEDGGEEKQEEEAVEEEEEKLSEGSQCPHKDPILQGNNPRERRSRHLRSSECDNKELKNLQIFGAGSKIMGLEIVEDGRPFLLRIYNTIPN